MISYHSVKSLNTTVSNKGYYHSCKVTSWDKAENETFSRNGEENSAMEC